MILWSYRLSNIHSVIAEVIDNSYVQVAPNIRMAGRRLRIGHQEEFKVPLAGRYQLYSETGAPVSAQMKVEGITLTPITLSADSKTITLLNGPEKALLLPEGTYAGLFKDGDDDKNLFANIYHR